MLRCHGGCRVKRATNEEGGGEKNEKEKAEAK